MNIQYAIRHTHGQFREGPVHAPGRYVSLEEATLYDSVEEVCSTLGQIGVTDLYAVAVELVPGEERWWECAASQAEAWAVKKSATAMFLASNPDRWVPRLDDAVKAEIHVISGSSTFVELAMAGEFTGVSFVPVRKVTSPARRVVRPLIPGEPEGGEG